MRAGTIVAANYFEMARLLGDSFLQQHPTSTFVILVIDDLPVPGETPGIEIARLGDLTYAATDLDRMKTIYDVMELSTAVKPNFLRWLLATHDGSGPAVYLDPDIFVYAPFDDVVEPAVEHGIVLTPHVLEPVPRDGLAVSERAIMQAGIFNLGFVAVGQPGRSFLDWWEQRLLVDAVSHVEVGLFTDQRWVDWVPALFDHVISRDPGMNVAWWNIHERLLAEGPEGELSANGHPLRFVHYSGFDPSDLDVLSKHAVPRPRHPHGPDMAIRRLADGYGQALLDGGHAAAKRTRYQWGTAQDGLIITRAIRRACRSALLGGAATAGDAGVIADQVPSAFGPTSTRLRPWLTADVAGSHLVRFNRVEVALWEERRDLQSAFPDRDGVDAERFRHWIDHDPGAADALGDLRRPSAVAVTPGRPTQSSWTRATRRAVPQAVARRAVRARGIIPPVGLRSRVSFLLNGPARIAELERTVDQLRHTLDAVESVQAERLDQIRLRVADVLDDVVARSGAVRGDGGDPAAIDSET